MRTWRVGSFSMGGALIFLGVFLLLVQFFDWDPAIALLSWWPLLFIILGIEILIYLGKKNTESNVKYDFISIIFISVIGTAGLGVALLQSVGLLELTNHYVAAEVREINLPKYEERNLTHIKHIQIEPGPYEVTIESTNNKEVVMFGTYVGDVVGSEQPLKHISDYALIEEVGDTLYIKLKQMPQGRFHHLFRDIDLTILLPHELPVEVNGTGGSVVMNLKEIQSDWTIVNLNHLQVKVPDQPNIKMDVKDAYTISGGKWENMATDTNNGEEEMYSVMQTFGTGAHHFLIKNVDSVDFK